MKNAMSHMHKCTYSTPRSWAYKFMPTTRHLIKTSCICGRATASGPYTEEYLKKKVWNVDVVGLFSLVWCPNWYITFRLPTLEKFSPSFIRIHHQLFLYQVYIFIPHYQLIRVFTIHWVLCSLGLLLHFYTTLFVLFSTTFSFITNQLV